MKKSDYEKMKKTEKEEKIFGRDIATAKQDAERYCARPHDHVADEPYSDKPFWDCVEEGAEKLAKQIKDKQINL